MSLVTFGLILIVILVGTFPPAQAGINATLSQHHGHPLWGALTNTLVASLVLGLGIATLRVPHAGLRSLGSGRIAADATTRSQPSGSRPALCS